jgi:hypothetical protein
MLLVVQIVPLAALTAIGIANCSLHRIRRDRQGDHLDAAEKQSAS